MATTKKQVKTTNKKEEVKLSKIGEWFKSGQSMIESYDMRAILK